MLQKKERHGTAIWEKIPIFTGHRLQMQRMVEWQGQYDDDGEVMMMIL